MEREIYVRLAVALTDRAVAEAEAVSEDFDIEAQYVEHALLRARRYAAMAAKIWGKE